MPAGAIEPGETSDASWCSGSPERRSVSRSDGNDSSRSSKAAASGTNTRTGTRWNTPLSCSSTPKTVSAEQFDDGETQGPEYFPPGGTSSFRPRVSSTPLFGLRGFDLLRATYRMRFHHRCERARLRSFFLPTRDKPGPARRNLDRRWNPISSCQVTTSNPSSSVGVSRCVDHVPRRFPRLLPFRGSEGRGQRSQISPSSIQNKRGRSSCLVGSEKITEPSAPRFTASSPT